MDQNNRSVWIGVIVVVIVVALGLWWYSANQSVNSATNAATSTAATTTATGPSVIMRNGDGVKAIVASLTGVSEFQSLFSSTGVSAMIGSGGQYTIFVPTDGAFASLPAGTISKMTAAQLKRLVEYHVVSGKAIQAGEQASGAIQALSGDPLNFSDINNIATVNSSIVVSEYEGSNGVVYVISGVLIPPQKATQ